MSYQVRGSKQCTEKAIGSFDNHPPRTMIFSNCRNCKMKMMQQ